jgi:exosome complex RNA-binding protein Csl4
MNATCTKCGMPLEMSWGFCPKCGLTVDRHELTVSHEAKPLAAPAEHEKSSVPGAFGGLLFGLIIAPVLIIFGTLLCLTGLGAFLGVPMIIAAILAPLAGPMLGIGEHKVRCPNCHTREITIADSRLHVCPNCNAEFALGENHHVVQAN